MEKKYSSGKMLLVITLQKVSEFSELQYLKGD